MEFAGGVVGGSIPGAKNEWFHDWKSQSDRDHSCLQVDDKATEPYTRAPSPRMMS